MKRICSLLLSFMLVFGLVACAEAAPTWQEKYDLGIKYLSEGNYEEAIIAFAAAIEIDPRQADAYISLAELYVSRGDYDAGLAVLQQGIDAVDDQRLRELWEELKATASLPPVPESLQDLYIPGNYHEWEEMEGLIPEQSIAAALTGNPDSALAAVRADVAVCEMVRRVAHGDPIHEKVWTQLENGALVLMEALCLTEEGTVRYNLSYREENGVACSVEVMFALPVEDVPQVQDQGRLNSFVYGLGECAGYLYHGTFSAWQRGEDWYSQETAAARNDAYHGERCIVYQDSTHHYYYENGQPVPYYKDGEGGLHCGRVQLEDGELRYRNSTIDGATRPCRFG